MSPTWNSKDFSLETVQTGNSCFLRHIFLSIKCAVKTAIFFLSPSLCAGQHASGCRLGRLFSQLCQRSKTRLTWTAAPEQPRGACDNAALPVLSTSHGPSKGQPGWQRGTAHVHPSGSEEEFIVQQTAGWWHFQERGASESWASQNYPQRLASPQTPSGSDESRNTTQQLEINTQISKKDLGRYGKSLGHIIQLIYKEWDLFKYFNPLIAIWALIRFA